MKNFIKIITCFTLLAFFNCNKDAEFQTSSFFQVTESHNDTVTLNVPDITSFEIIPEHAIDINTFDFKYNVVDGSGIYRNFFGDTLVPNEWYDLDSLSFDYPFIGDVFGKFETNITIRDNGDQQTFSLNYFVDHNPFSIAINTVNTSVTVNEKKPFILNLDNKGKDKTVTYDVQLFISQGSGEIELFDNENNSLGLVKQDESFSLIPGVYNYSVTFLEEGNNIINTKVTDSNNQILVDSIEFNVNTVNFEFNGEPSKTGTPLGEAIDLNFSIFETDGGDSNYSVRYSIEEGDALLNFNGGVIAPGVNTDVPSGDFSWNFIPQKTGLVTLKFTAFNESGVNEEVIINIMVDDRSFNYTATPSLTNLNLGETVNITYDITEVGGNEIDSYTLVFSSNLNGTLSLNGTSYNPGEIITIPSLIFTASYTPNQPGIHIISNSITANSNRLSVSKDVEFEVIANIFDFSVTPSETELFINGSTDITFNVTGSIPDANYSIRYAFNTSSGEIINTSNSRLSSGINYDIINNQFTWQLTATNNNDITVTFFVKDTATNIEIFKTINIAVSRPDYTLVVTRERAEETVNESVGINININEITGTSSNYRAYYRSSSNGVFEYNGQFYNPGEIFILTGLSSSGEYTGEISGTHNFEIVTLNIVNVERDDNVSIEFTDIEFSMAVSSQQITSDPRPNGNIVGDNVRIIHNITEDGGIGSYKVSYTISGVVNPITNQSGNTLSPNVQYNVDDLNFNWNLKADNVGETIINYLLEDAFGNFFRTSETIVINNLGFDFNLISLDNQVLTERFSRIQIDMNAPSQLNYTFQVSTNRNTDIDINYNGNSFSQNTPISIGSNGGNFSVKTRVSGNVTLTVVINASNGVNVTRNITLDFYRTPTISSARYGTALQLGPCSSNRQCSAGPAVHRTVISFSKDNGTRIASYTLSNGANRVSFPVALNGSDLLLDNTIRIEGAGSRRALSVSPVIGKEQERLDGGYFSGNISIFITDNNGFNSDAISIRAEMLSDLIRDLGE